MNYKGNLSEFCLGTVQFGMNYGLKNVRNTEIDEIEIEKIFNFFHENGGIYIDTAQNYGNSEKKISNFLNNSSKVITKIEINQRDQILEMINKSLRNLNISKLDTILIHNPEIIRGSTKSLDQLIKLKEDKYTDNIGISIYSHEDITDLPEHQQEKILNNIDVLQVPCNAFDKNFFNHKNYKSLRKDIRVDKRSIFLQGLLLQDYITATKLFPEFKNELKLWEDYCIHNRLSRLEASIGNILDYDNRNSLILFGCRNLKEIKEILHSYEAIYKKKFKKLNKIFPKELIDPRRWK